MEKGKEEDGKWEEKKIGKYDRKEEEIEVGDEEK